MECRGVNSQTNFSGKPAMKICVSLYDLEIVWMVLVWCRYATFTNTKKSDCVQGSEIEFILNDVERKFLAERGLLLIGQGQEKKFWMRKICKKN